MATKLSKAKPNNVLRGMEAHIPDISNYDNHIQRTLTGGMTETEMFDYAMKSVSNVLIEGPSGSGKTSGSLAYAALRKMPFYAIPSNAGIEPSQLFGRYIPDEIEGGFRWVDGPVTAIVRHGGVLLINEINFMPERISTVLFGLLDKRRQITLLDHEAETIVGSKDLLIVGDMNPGYEGTRPLNKAFRNRFAIQLTWDYDPKVESKLVVSKSLREFAHKIRKMTQTGEYTTPVGTNLLMEFERIAKDTNFAFAVSNLVSHFAEVERDAIATTLKAYSGNIELELGLNADEEDDEDVVLSSYPPEHEIWTKRAEAAKGYRDPELGIKGIDWN